MTSFTEKGEGSGEALSDDMVKSWFDKTVDDVYDDEENLLKDIVSFLLEYAFHAAPKDATFSEIKAEQVATYDHDPTKEISNGFKCLIEYLTKTDMGWCTWQYYNSVPDWEAKRIQGMTGRHNLKSRFTGDRHSRHQPEENSEGMNLYKKMTEWYGEFKSHEGFKEKARPLCNELSKKMNLIPTWTVDSGPKKSGRKRADPPPDATAPEVELSDDDEANVGGYNAMSNARNNFGQFDKSSSDDEENDDDCD